MTRRAPNALPPPTMQERADAAIAARALRAAIPNPSTMQTWDCPGLMDG